MVKLTRDKNSSNSSSKNSLGIPKLSLEPSVSQPGQLYYNTTNDTMNYSIGVNEWVEVSSSGGGGNVIEGDLFVTGNIEGNCIISAPQLLGGMNSVAI